MDEGVDYTHPDLRGVMYGTNHAAEMLDFADKTGLGGQYGYNPQDPDRQGDPMPINAFQDARATTGHGTHVAGLIASEWNGEGTSGVASGVEIISVAELGTGAYSGSSYAMLKGFAYVSKLVDYGIDVRAINLSMGGEDPSNARNIAITRLGEKGVVTVYAAGNDSANLDTDRDDGGAHMSSPYTLVVGASEAGGYFDRNYSNYGSAVSFFAPGTSDLSTIPTICSYSRGTYIPGATADTPICYEKFDTPAATQNIALYYPSEGTWPSVEAQYSDKVSYEKNSGSIYLDPAPMPGDNYPTIFVGIKVGQENVDKSAILTIGEGEEKEEYIDITKAKRYRELSGQDNFNAAANFLSFTWGTGSTDKQYFFATPFLFEDGKGTSNAYGFINSNYEDEGITDAINYYSLDQYANINLHKAVTRARKAGSKYRNIIGTQIGGNIGDDTRPVEYYIFLRVSLYNRQVPVYFDTVGVGSKNVAYMFMNGTSMAAPVSTGLLSVIYQECKDDPGFKNLSSSSQALYVIDRMKSSVTQTDDMKGNCQTNGRLDASKRTTVRPVMTKVSLSQDGAYDIIVEGNHFGLQNAGTDSVTLTGFETDGHTGTPITLKVKSWTDKKIICEKPSQIRSAVYNISVNKSTESTNLSASLKFSDADLYENDIIAPRELSAEEIFNLDTKLLESDFRSTSIYTSMTVADGKLFIMPYSLGVYPSKEAWTKYLWMYDPSLGTGENAFKRVMDAADILGWEKMGTADVVTVDNQVYVVSNIDNGEGKEETSALIKVDPNTFKTEIIRFPKALETNEYNFICPSGDYLVFVNIPNKDQAKKTSGRYVTVFAFNVKNKAYIEEMTVKLPNGYIHNGKALSVRVANDRLYILGEFALDDYGSSHAVKFLEYKFLLNDNVLGFAFNREREVPKIVSGRKASFALEVLADGPAIVALNNATGQDYGYDTFLYKYGETGYSKYSRKVSLGNVWYPIVAAGNDTMYVVGFDYFNKNYNYILRSTKIATIDHKNQEEKKSSGGGGGGFISGTSMPAYVAKSGAWEKNADGTWRFKGAVNLTGTNGYNKTDANGFFVDTWAAIADSTYSQSGTTYHWYKFDKNGKMLTGWFTDTDGRIYYLNPKSDGTMGVMMTGWVVIDGKEYYFNEASDGTKGALVPDKKK